MDHEVTWVDADIVVCNNCGAHANKIKNIKHHPTCTPGESKKWEEFYADQEFDEEEREFYGLDDDDEYEPCTGRCNACDQYDYCNPSPNSR